MIQPLENFQIKIERDSNRPIYTIFSYEPINLSPNFFKLITLPYKRIDLKGNYTFLINDKLAENGIICTRNNLNEETSLKNLEFMFWNLNVEIPYQRTSIESIMGSNKIVKIRPNEVLGKIFC